MAQGRVCGVGPAVPEQGPGRNRAASEPGRFARILEQAQEQHAARFSKHAAARLEDRGIQMSSQELTRLDGAIARARDKGSQSALVLIDGRAFIVGPQSGTVVTALDREDMKSHVFTNIDATVVA